ncbi:cytochrome P450 [Kitasatospora sp. NBC_01266]|uniref:cytochrome P450 n=1 Tax=Kitasatospora sp. NBC_01266 TaxID=2903572 RepID=UPI002E342A0B|nr:cytochrome P450 [Kitasatospora sp. NBC_01266]
MPELSTPATTVRGTTAPDPTIPDLTDPRSFLPEPPYHVWAALRRSGGLYYQERQGAPGFHSVTRYRDIDAVFRDSDGFSSEWGMTLDTALGVHDPAAGKMIELTDPPRHRRLRTLVSGGLNRSVARTMDGVLRDRVDAWVAQAVAAGETDFVDAVSERVPSAATGLLLGLPEREWAKLADRASRAVCGSLALDDPRVGDLTARRHSTATANGQLMVHLAGLLDHAELAEDGLIRRLLDAEIDGDRLTREEVLLNCLNLAIAGNETTKNATTGGLVAFARHPEQWHLLRRQPELLDQAVEEILRYCTPPQHFTRTVIEPRTVAGTPLRPGELLCLWMPSANRDEEVFTDPDAFRIDRHPNPHLAFTSGKHFCLGASLARLEIRLVFESLLRRVESIHLLGAPTRKPTNLVLAYAGLPVAFRVG